LVGPGRRRVGPFWPPRNSSSTASELLVENVEEAIPNVRFEVLAVTLKNAVFGDIKPQFIPHRRRIKYPLHKPAG
jgi:hypothetical protein